MSAPAIAHPDATSDAGVMRLSGLSTDCCYIILRRSRSASFIRAAYT